MKSLKRITALLLVLALGVLAPLGASATTGLNAQAVRILTALEDANVPPQFVNLTRATMLAADIQPTEAEANQVIALIGQARALIPEGINSLEDLPLG